MSEPVFLYNDPHPIHEQMANKIGSEFVECSKGGPFERMRVGLSREFGSRPVLIEGGVPLLEAGFIGLRGRSGPIIELAADGTLIDIATSLDGRPTHERFAHRFGERFVDGTLAVSDYLAAYAREYNRPVEVIHPFVEAERYAELKTLSPGGDGEAVLCIGKYRHKNGQDVLLKAVEQFDDDTTMHFVGSDTNNISPQEGVEAHGFVDLPQFYDILDRADLMVFPARVGAYPVAVLEALLSGTPVVTSPYVGNADLVRAVHPGYVTEPDPSNVLKTMVWAKERDLVADGRLARETASGFHEDRYVADFEKRFNQVLANITRGQR